MNRHRPTRGSQRGVGALAVTMLLLFTMSFIALFANRSLLFEQRSSANQYRSMRAFEMAEAGVEWATAMLNDPRAIDARCVAAASGVSFRDKYLPHDTNFRFTPVTNVRPACRVSGNALACACPQPGDAVDLGASNDASFSVTLAEVAGDPGSVQLTAWGCTGQGTQCVPGSAHGASDATARVSIVLKLKPLLRVIPAAAVTAGGAVDISGPVAISNLDVASSGALIHAGLGITTASSVTLATLPGSPPLNALIGNDSALDSGTLFNAFFGMTPDRFMTAGPVHRISADSPTARALALKAAYEQGHSAFHVDGELLFDAAAVGSATRPILVASAHPLGCSGPCEIHGLVYTDAAARDASDLANVSIHGAVVTRGQHNQAGGGAIAYQAATLQTLRHRTGMLVRVPGSWRDF